MNINQLKHEVLNNNVAIEYDNKDLEKLRKVLEYIFPEVYTKSWGNFIYYFKQSFDNNDWTCDDVYNGTSIPLSQITFDEQPTLKDVIELRKKFPNDWDFAQEFDKLIKNLK